MERNVVFKKESSYHWHQAEKYSRRWRKLLKFVKSGRIVRIIVFEEEMDDSDLWLLKCFVTPNQVKTAELGAV